MCCCYIGIIFVLIILITDYLPYFSALNATLSDQLKICITQQYIVYEVDCSTVQSSHFTNQLFKLEAIRYHIIAENVNI